MLRKISLLCFLLVLFVVTTPVFASELTTITITDLESNEVSTEDFLGEEYLIFEVWTTWCPSCVASMNDFQENLDLFGENDIKIVAISLDDRLSTVNNFVENNGIEFTVLHDPRSRAAMQWNVRAIPAVFLVAPDGELLLRKEGYTGFDSFWEEITAEIEKHRTAKSGEDKEDEEKEAINSFDLEVVELDTEFFRGFVDFFEFRAMEPIPEDNFDPVAGAMGFYHFFIGSDGFIAVTLNEGEHGLPQHLHLAPIDEESQPAQTLHLEHLGEQLDQQIAGVVSEIMVKLDPSYQAPYHLETYIWDNGMAGFYALPNQGFRGTIKLPELGEQEVLIVDLGGNTFMDPAMSYILVDLNGDGNFSSEGVFRMTDINIAGKNFSGQLVLPGLQLEIREK